MDLLPSMKPTVLMLVLAIVGAAGGYTVSYWFQGGLVGLTMDLGDYLSNVGRILDGTESVRQTAYIGIGIGALLGGAVGFFAGRRA